MTPQIIMLCLLFGGIVLHAAKDGKPRDNYNWKTKIFAVVIQFLLLWWGGFWANINF